jgi:hypothetical protein
LIEGPNGTAKTTLAKQLASFFDLLYVKENKPDEPGFKYYLRRAKEMGPCVLDRFHLGERVYPQIKKDGRVPLERWQQREIERVLLSSGAILVRCDATQEFKRRVHETRGETFITVDDIPIEEEFFNSAFSDSILPTIRTTLRTIEDISEEDRLSDVLGQIGHAWFKTQHADMIGRTFQGAGNIGQHGRPIMLVGERYADKSYVDESHDHRALCGDRNGSAFLHRALDLTDMLANRSYLTNLWKYQDDDKNRVDLRNEIEMLRPTSIVALGKRVDKQLTAWHIRHGVVDHPQHRARFFYNDVDRYTVDITAAIQEGIQI